MGGHCRGHLSGVVIWSLCEAPLPGPIDHTVVPDLQPVSVWLSIGLPTAYPHHLSVVDGRRSDEALFALLCVPRLPLRPRPLARAGSYHPPARTALLDRPPSCGGVRRDHEDKSRQASRRCGPLARWWEIDSSGISRPPRGEYDPWRPARPVAPVAWTRCDGLNRVGDLPDSRASRLHTVRLSWVCNNFFITDLRELMSESVVTCCFDQGLTAC